MTNIPNRDIIKIPIWYSFERKRVEITKMRLKEIRTSRGVSQLKLALDLNMTQNSISRYENGVRQADYQTLIAFADYFQVSLDYLLERIDEPDATLDSHR